MECSAFALFKICPPEITIHIPIIFDINVHGSTSISVTAEIHPVLWNGSPVNSVEFHFLFLFEIRHFGEKICIGVRNSKLGAGREQRQKTPGISSWGLNLF